MFGILLSRGVLLPLLNKESNILSKVNSVHISSSLFLATGSTNIYIPFTFWLKSSVLARDIFAKMNHDKNHFLRHSTCEFIFKNFIFFYL